jgi:hypothetical protein
VVDESTYQEWLADEYWVELKDLSPAVHDDT